MSCPTCGSCTCPGRCHEVGMPAAAPARPLGGAVNGLDTGPRLTREEFRTRQQELYARPACRPEPRPLGCCLGCWEDYREVAALERDYLCGVHRAQMSVLDLEVEVRLAKVRLELAELAASRVASW